MQDRLLAQLSIAFGVVAVLLAAIGLYGVLSYGVARRTNEIGIRKALGAQQGTLIAMILRETSWLLVVGVIAGCALSAATIRLITSRSLRAVGQRPGDVCQRHRWTVDSRDAGDLAARLSGLAGRSAGGAAVRVGPQEIGLVSRSQPVGTWGTGLFADDEACDIRDHYRELLEDGVRTEPRHG